MTHQAPSESIDGDALLTVEEACALTRHASTSAFYRWAKAHPETKSRHGFYSKRAIERAIYRPKPRAAWKATPATGKIVKRRQAK